MVVGEVVGGGGGSHDTAGETVTLLRPPLPLAGVPIAMERERQQSDRTLADGSTGQSRSPAPLPHHGRPSSGRHGATRRLR